MATIVRLSKWFFLGRSPFYLLYIRNDLPILINRAFELLFTRLGALLVIRRDLVGEKEIFSGAALHHESGKEDRHKGAKEYIDAELDPIRLFNALIHHLDTHVKCTIGDHNREQHPVHIVIDKHGHGEIGQGEKENENGESVVADVCVFDRIANRFVVGQAFEYVRLGKENASQHTSSHEKTHIDRTRVVLERESENKKTPCDNGGREKRETDEEIRHAFWIQDPKGGESVLCGWGKRFVCSCLLLLVHIIYHLGFI